jgi:hypothetical protein
MGLGLAFAIVAGRRLNAIRNRIFDPTRAGISILRRRFRPRW